MHAKHIIVSIALGWGLVVMPHQVGAFAGIGDTAVVFDPANLEQALVVVENLYTQIAQTKELIEHQVAMVSQGTQDLLATPVNLLQQITDLTNQYNSALANVQGVGYTFDGIKQQWNALYGTSGGTSLSQRAQAISQAIQYASGVAAQMQSMYTRMGFQTSQMKTLLAANTAASGNLAAQQVQTQVNGVLSDQLNTLTQVHMTEARVHVMQIADDARTTEQAGTNNQNWIRGFNDAEHMPVPFGQGKGPTLD